MSRYTGPIQRINRRFGQAILQTSKAFEKRPFPSGIHGAARQRRKVSEYGAGLNEKQKLRFMYGLTEKQFRLLFERAKSRAKAESGVTGDYFLRMLESRLDNIVYRMGWALSRAAARQFVNHGHIRVNDIKVDIASYLCKPGDVITVGGKSSSKQLATRCSEALMDRVIPAWLSRDDLRGVVNRFPDRSECEQSIQVQLIVEFYSR
jgi:small subunit ribosomal protein S4